MTHQYEVIRLGSFHIVEFMSLAKALAYCKDTMGFAGGDYRLYSRVTGKTIKEFHVW